jgi:hypothetical protein
MPYGPGAKAEVLSILAFRAYTTWANSYPALGSAFQKIGTRRPVPREIVVLMDAALAGCN